MSWIKMRGGLLNSPKVAAMTRALESTVAFRNWLVPDGPRRGKIVSDEALRCVTVALLLRVWSSLREHGSFVESDLVLPYLHLSDIDGIAGVVGFGKAMQSVGWVREDNGIVVPNFLEYNVPRTNADRQRDYRSRVKPLPVKTVTPRNETVTTNALLEKRRVEKSTGTPTEYPEGLRSAGFKKVWEEWESHRKEIKKPLTPTSRGQQLQNLAAMGEAKAIETIKHTIFKGWQGLKEPENNGTHQRNNAESRRNVGTANEGRSSQYAGVGKVQ